MPQHVTFGTIQATDFAEVAQYLARQVRPGEAVPAASMPPERRLHWLLAENPARIPDVPFGWCLRGPAGDIVGTLLCIPFRVGVAGVTHAALMSCKSFVDEPYRGMGVVLFRSYLRFARQYPLFCTSANAVSGELFARAGGYVIEGTDHTMLGVARPAPLVEEWVYRRVRSSAAARILALPALLAPSRQIGGHDDGELFAIHAADEVLELGLSPPESAVAVLRDRAYLQWRYFSGEPGKDVLGFRTPGGETRMVTVTQVRSGYRAQIRVLNVLDVWPPLTTASAPLMVRLLWQQYRGSFDALWLRSQPPAAEEALHRVGFVRHAFPAPLGWCIDPCNLLPSRPWYLMPGESE